MSARLYLLATSHPARAAQGMLRHKGIAHRPVYLLPGLHPPLLRAAGFAGSTVPALELEGRRIQGSRSISRALDAAQAEPRLFPDDPAQRSAVEEAERWGEQELQGVPRRIFRWAAANQQPVRRWLAEVSRLPAPGIAAGLIAPMAWHFAAGSGADEERVRRDLGDLPATLDHVDRLIEAGTIGSATLNAADFQIGSSVRVLMTFDQLRAQIGARPAGALALRLFPSFPEPVPAKLPGEV